jgi:hypothetical protein
MKIVIVADPSRQDFYNYIVDNLASHHELRLLWHYTKQNAEVPTYGNCSFLYWNDYFTPWQFFKKERPDRVLFFEIIDFWQISLVIACHRFKVVSFFVEHGVGSDVRTVISRFNEVPSVKQRLSYYLKKLAFNSYRVFRSRVFFFAAARYLSSQEKGKCIKLFYYYKKYTPIHALSLVKFRRRTPHYAILFNRNNIRSFLLYNEIERSCILTPGVPFFDRYFRSEVSEKEHIVFIEHPYLESHLLGWDDPYHEKIARAIEALAIKEQTNIIVKLHPFSDIRNWTRYSLTSLVTIKQQEDITNELLSAKLILGYSSTLMNVLIASKKNVVLLGWHPKAQIFGDDLSRTGLCHVSFAPSELFEKYDYWIANNSATSNPSALKQFLEEYNYPFDGKATERIIDIILQNEVS